MTSTATSIPRDPAQPAAGAKEQRSGGASAETARAFAARADELSQWARLRIVNRIDVWGGYLPLAVREGGKPANVTKPAIANRGQRQLTPAIVKAHFIGADQGDIVGLHAIAPDNSCKWFAIEVDAHGEDRPDNWPATLRIIERLEGKGLFALVTDSNGRGGFHILVVLNSPLPSDVVYRFAQSIIDDWKELGLSERPEIFPKQPKLDELKKFGNWLRLPGRHHTRNHWSSVWGGDAWYDGDDAVDLILKCPVNSSEIVAKLAPPEQKPPTPKPINGNCHHVDDADKVMRASKYIDKIPGAISGQRGHDQTLSVACELFRFGLSDMDASALLSDYNQRCQPAWSEAELEHKLNDARAKVDGAGEFGCRLHEDRPGWDGNGKHSKGRQNKPTSDGSPEDQQDANDRATELANCEELHRRHGPKIKYHKDRREFYIYTGTHWRRDLFGEVNRWAKEVARKSTDRLAQVVEGRELSRFAKQVESARGISGVLKLLESETDIPATADDFDRNDHLLSTANGTLELAVNPKLRPHDPKDMITHCLSTPYYPGAKCNLWESVVNRALAENLKVIRYLQRWAGAFLTGAANIHELLICYGIGANSKSVIFDTLCWLLESLAGIAPDSLLMARHGISEHPTEIMDLLGKRLIVASETESGATLRLQLLKRLTGDSVLKGRFMRCNFVEFRRTHKMVLITNNKPRLTENTEAVWRRLRLLPFNVVIPPAERDPNLLEKLKAEAPGILAWCVRGCAEMLRDGMNPPDEVLVATMAYRDESDELQPFIEAHCIAGDAETFRVSRADLFTAYTAWAKASNERHSLDRAALYEQIRRREGIVEDQWKVAGKPIRGFRGLGLMAKTDER